MVKNDVRGVVAGIGLLSASLAGCERSPSELQLPQSPANSQSARSVSEPAKIEVAKPWVDNGSGLYMFSFDNAWPTNLARFCADNPNLTIVDIAKNRENGSYSRTTSVVVLTTPKDALHFGESVVKEFPFDDSWPGSLRDFVVKNPDLQVSASFPGEEGGSYSRVTTMLVVANRVLKLTTDSNGAPKDGAR